MNLQQIHQQLLAWYDQERRDLPWRRSKDPYRVWISEIMLQQTRVETVVPYYERFLSNFPAVKDLAEADQDRLLNLWAGLGYYSRARNLQAAAKDVMERFAGKFPMALEDLRSLKGVGPYTAAAIASISYDQPYAAIDGNLERVFSRLLASRLNPKTEGRSLLENLGAKLVALGRAGDFNQACMDLSSRVCLPKEPRCSDCPVGEQCSARIQGIQREIPVKKAKAAPTELRALGVIVVAEKSLLLARRPQGEWLSGMWDIPWWLERDGAGRNAPAGSAQFAACAQTRTITKHKIHFEVRAYQYETRPTDLGSLPGAEFRWVSLEDLHGINLPRPSERALERTLQELLPRQ